MTTYRIEWDNEEKTVVLLEYLVGATKSDLYEMAKISAEMLATVPHTVHQIIDERNIHLVLNSADLQYLEKNVPPNQGKVIVIPPVGSDGYKQIVKKLASRPAPKAFNQVIFVASLEEAREILMELTGVMY